MRLHLNPFTGRKYGENTISICCPHRNCYNYNDVLQKQKNKASRTWWQHVLLWHWHRCLKRRYICIGVLKEDALPQVSWKETHVHRDFERSYIATGFFKRDTLAQGFCKEIHCHRCLKRRCFGTGVLKGDPWLQVS